ncbi:MAG: hypothetical protein K2G60_07185 [Oscillospiraceae bacterium]|nr:hypothetical protein [Oscillospiraceae bacterium]
MDLFNRKKLLILTQELANTKELLKKANEENERLKEKSFKKNDSDFDALRKRIIQDKCLAKSIYVGKQYFMSWYESRLYRLLCDIVNSNELKEYGLIVFSQVRLADIVKRWEDCYSSEKASDNSFIKAISKNGGKRAINTLLLESKNDFNNHDFDELFLYPLLRSHVDFLICRTLSPNTEEERLVPLMVIELFGQEHFDVNGRNRQLQRNDEFKKYLFEATEIGFDNSLKNETLKNALKDNDKLDDLKAELQGKFSDLSGMTMIGEKVMQKI